MEFQAREGSKIPLGRVEALRGKPWGLYAKVAKAWNERGKKKLKEKTVLEFESTQKNWDTPTTHHVWIAGSTTNPPFNAFIVHHTDLTAPLFMNYCPPNGQTKWLTSSFLFFSIFPQKNKFQTFYPTFYSFIHSYSLTKFANCNPQTVKGCCCL